MGLPQVSLPLFEIEIPPKGDKIDFRPFLVKEEKLLIMASESGELQDMMKATQQIVTNCSMGKVDGSKLPLFALQKVFMDLRSASISNIIDLNLVCGNCGTIHEHQLDLQDLKITYDEKHVNPIDMAGIIINMKYPDAKTLSEMFESDTIEDLYSVVAKCIEVIYDGDEQINAEDVTHQELLEWVEELPAQQFAGLREFLETMPVLEHSIDFTCGNCSTENTMTMNGYQNFFV